MLFLGSVLVLELSIGLRLLLLWWLLLLLLEQLLLLLLLLSTKWRWLLLIVLLWLLRLSLYGLLLRLSLYRLLQILYRYAVEELVLIGHSRNARTQIDVHVIHLLVYLQAGARKHLPHNIVVQKLLHIRLRRWLYLLLWRHVVADHRVLHLELGLLVLLLAGGDYWGRDLVALALANGRLVEVLIVCALF